MRMPMDLVEQVEAIQTREDLVAFVRALLADLVENADKAEWENPTLERYLEALAAWTEDMDGYFLNTGQPIPEQPTWNLIGQMLYAAKIYE